ncbi:50S ribosomal protein L19e [Candidatus Woesearchaeota archaeon]|nr:50S ribosomal protein L19e [Candidatus Woesearchaeota archaeon]
MKLKIQKRLAAQMLKRSQKKVKLDPTQLTEIKEAITKKDVKDLIDDKIIKGIPKRGVSRARARKNEEQKAKGRRKGIGSRKGKQTARTPKKAAWMAKVRSQRNFLKTLKEKEIVDNPTYRNLYTKVGGGFFRSQRHIKLYITEHKLTK